MAEVKFNDLLHSAETLRIDPEYFHKIHLLDEQITIENPDRFTGFSDIGLSVDASAFYPSIEYHYGTGEFPFLRVADVDKVIDFERCTHIPESLTEMYPTLKKAFYGDIVLTKGGSVARVGFVTESAAVSRDLIYINSSTLPEDTSKALSTYFQTDFFRRLLMRSSSQTAQPHLTITLVRNLPVLRMGENLEKAIATVFNKANHTRQMSISLQQKAESLLLSELGLAHWQPPEALTYERSSNEVFEAGRLDAEFHRPKFDGIKDTLSKNFNLRDLGEMGEVTKGITVPYCDNGAIKVIRSGDLSNIDSDDKFLSTDRISDVFLLNKGDVLISSIGFGSIGKVRVFDLDGTYATVSEVTVIRQSEFNPFYLSSFLSSEIGQVQIDRYITGATGQLHLYPRDVKKLWIPVIDSEIQKDFEQLAKTAKAAKQHSSQLLEAAKRAVEIAIEDSEAAALAYLNESTVALNRSHQPS